MKSFFITATGTGTGKTFVTCALSWQLRQQGKKVTALKPVISGYDPQDTLSDTAQILSSCGLAATPAQVRAISPWRYRAPLAPNMAAAREGNPVNFNRLLQFCDDHAALESDVLLVEGAGGLMAPVTDSHTMLDWMAALHWPGILVAGSYLGAISHTLTAIEALKARKIPLHCIIICESADSGVDLGETSATLEKFLPSGGPLVKVPRISTADEAWKHAPSLFWLCE